MTVRYMIDMMGCKMSELIEIRSSSLPMWNDCPRRSAARVLRNEIQMIGIKLARENRSIGAICGTATHAGAAFVLSTKMKDGTLGDEGAATDVAVESIRTSIKEEVVEWDATTASTRMAESAVVRQVKQYRKDVASKVEPKMVEQSLKAEWGPIYLTGHVDLVTQDDVLRDIKGGRKRPNASQYGGYAQLLKANGIAVTGIIEDGIARVHDAKPQPPIDSRPIDIDVAKELAREVLNNIFDQVTEFRTHNKPTAFPANPQSMLCGPKYCPAWGGEWCQAWKLKQA